jgi:hypothetical protein
MCAGRSSVLGQRRPSLTSLSSLCFKLDFYELAARAPGAAAAIACCDELIALRREQAPPSSSTAAGFRPRARVASELSPDPRPTRRRSARSASAGRGSRVAGRLRKVPVGAGWRRRDPVAALGAAILRLFDALGAGCMGEPARARCYATAEQPGVFHVEHWAGRAGDAGAGARRRVQATRDRAETVAPWPTASRATCRRPIAPTVAVAGPRARRSRARASGGPLLRRQKW